MTKPPYHHGELAPRLIAEGTRLVLERGHAAVSVRDVTRRVGVSHAAAHYHFPTRESLLAAIAERGYRAMTAALIDALDEADRFAALGPAYVAWALKHGKLYELMFSAETADRDAYPTLHAAADAMFNLLVECVSESQRIRAAPAGVPIEIALAAWSSAHGIATLLIEKRVRLPGLSRRPIKDLISIALSGIHRARR